MVRDWIAAGDTCRFPRRLGRCALCGRGNGSYCGHPNNEATAIELGRTRKFSGFHVFLHVQDQ
jgi:hypothetical protein